MFPPDFKELLSVFNSRKIRYLLIGGYAVSLHAQPRGTKDLDLLLSPDAENAHALYAALAEFGAPLGGIKAADFMDPTMFFRMPRRRNLWVTDTLQWRRNPGSLSPRTCAGFSSLLFVASCLLNQVLP